MTKLFLPVVRSSSPHLGLPRRRVLAVLSGVAVAPLAACVTSSGSVPESLKDPQDPDRGSESDAGTSTSHDAPGTDTGSSSSVDAGTDTGSSSSVDSGTDTGSSSSGDAGGDSGYDAGATCTPTGTKIGSSSTYPASTWTGDASDEVIIGHDSGGLFAYSATCTHHGCSLANDIDRSTGDVTCSCHGWQFDGNGACSTEPSKPLVHYALTVCDGFVYVDTGTTVAATTRTPVP